MVKRKYITNKILFIISVYIFCIHSTSRADAWLPDMGEYQYTSSFSIIDKPSKKLKNLRSSAFVEIRNEIESLYFRRNMIISNAANSRIPLKNSEIREIEEINSKIDELDELSIITSAFKDEQSAHLSIEYGATTKQSFGTKLIYSIDKFAGYNDPNHNKKHISASADLFYKYQLFRNEKFAISLKPAVQFSTYNNKNSCKHADIALFIGSSKHKDNGKVLFHEFGFSLKKYFENAIGKKMGYSISSLDGVKFKSGIIFTNYAEYSRNSLKNLAYSNTIYEQFSIGKEFSFEEQKPRNLAIQVGYFWKRTKLSKVFTISGPIISAWLNI
jgi:hypothetical protein